MSTDPFREELLRQTLKIVSRRAQVRRAFTGVALALAFAAGVATTSLIQRIDARTVEPVEEPMLAEINARPPLLAANPRINAMRRLREEGDQLLAEHADVGSALIRYRELLLLMSPEDRQRVDPNDSWLLSTLKQSQWTN